MDELDRILSSEEAIEPSSGLANAVMRAVREQAAAPPPIRFPWARLALGAGTALLFIVGVAVALLAGVVPVPAEPWDASALLDDPTVVSLGWAVLALTLSYTSYAVSLRLAGLRGR